MTNTYSGSHYNTSKGLPVVQIPLINIQTSNLQQQANVNVHNASDRASIGHCSSTGTGRGLNVKTWHQKQVEYSKSIITNSKMTSNASSISHNSANLLQLRQEILSKISIKRAHFQGLITFWKFVYYSLVMLGFAGHGLSIGLSSSYIRQIVSGGGTADSTMSADDVDFTSQVIIAVGSCIYVVAYTLNTQLQSHMNATYFSEAVARYSQLEVDLLETSLSEEGPNFEDLVVGVWNMMQVLDEMYDKAGVGPMISLGGLVEKLNKLIGGDEESKPAPKPKPSNEPDHDRSRSIAGPSNRQPSRKSSTVQVDYRYVGEMPKRYAYPEPRVIQQRERREQRRIDAMKRQYQAEYERQSQIQGQLDRTRGDQRYFTYHI